MTNDKEFDTAKTEVDSIGRRGEDIDRQEPEAGRSDTAPEGATKRMAGTSTSRDFTSVDPQETVSHNDEDRSPAG